jgi:hypothetical protein
MITHAGEGDIKSFSEAATPPFNMDGLITRKIELQGCPRKRCQLSRRFVEATNPACISSWISGLSQPGEA